MTEELLTLAEVREYLRLSDSTIRRMLKDGRLTGVLIAGRWRVPKAVVEELARGAVGSVTVIGAWYVNTMANRIVVELPGGEFKHFAVVPFRAVTLAEMDPYQGYHPVQMTGGAQMVPDYVLRHYGLSLATVSGNERLVRRGTRALRVSAAGGRTSRLRGESGNVER